MIDLEQIAYDISVGKSSEVTRWLLPIATLEEMIALIRKQEATLKEQVELNMKLITINDQPIHLAETSPAEPIVTVDTSDFQDILGQMQNEYWRPEQINAWHGRLIAHIDAHTAAAVAQAKKSGYVDGYTKATVEHNQRRECIPEPDAAPQQHAQAVLSDEQIIEIATKTRSAEANKDGGYILPISFARAILASQQPVATPDLPSPNWTADDQREQEYFDRYPNNGAPVAASAPQGEPDAAFAQFCDREGYPSDGPFDAALRKAFDAGRATQPPAEAAPGDANPLSSDDIKVRMRHYTRAEKSTERKRRSLQSPAQAEPLSQPAAVIQGDAEEVSESQIDAAIQKLRDLDASIWSRGGTDLRYMMRKILNAAIRALNKGG